MADTAALVIALSAQLTKFEKDLQKAGVIAEKSVRDIENKFEKMNPKISTSFFGNFLANMADKALSGAIDGLKQLEDRFKSLQQTAELTGLSLQWLYGLQEAGRKGGASVGEINAAVEKLAFLLDEMQRGGDNALKTLLDANPQFLKGASRDALDLSQTLKIVADILGNAKNNVQAMDIGRNLGIPDNVVRAWQMGGDAMMQIAAQAAKAAPDLERAAAMAKLLGDAWDALVAKAKQGALEGAFIYLNYLASAYLTLLEAILPALQAINTQAANIVQKAIEGLQRGKAAIAEARAERGGGDEAPRTRLRVTAGGSAVDPFARRNPPGERDEFQRQSDQITKHIALMEADARAVGLNVGEQERLRTETLLLEAERRRLNIAEGEAIPISDELAEKIKKQADAAAQARMQLAEATDRLNKINSASQQLGSALSSAFADAILEGKKLNDVMQSLLKTLARAAINSAFTSIFSPSGTGGTSPFLQMLGIGARAGGGPVAAGKAYIVGENGPELMVPSQAGMVVPNAAMGKAGGGMAFAVNYSIDASGADPSSIARLQAALVATNRSIESRAVAAIQQHMARAA